MHYPVMQNPQSCHSAIVVAGIFKASKIGHDIICIFCIGNVLGLFNQSYQRPRAAGEHFCTMMFSLCKTDGVYSSYHPVALEICIKNGKIERICLPQARKFGSKAM